MRYIITDGKGKYASFVNYRWQVLASIEWATRFDDKDSVNRMLDHLKETLPNTWENFNVSEERPKVIKHNFA